MEAGALPVLVALALFAAKHFIADFVLQTARMRGGKGQYGHPGGLAHAGLHMAASLPALAVLGAGLPAMLLLVVFEGLAHYHIDWSKEYLTRRLALGPGQRGFWVLIGADQFLHQLTYLAMIAAALAMRA